MLDHAGIRALLPHRHPMILLDRIIAVRPGAAITAEKSVSGCEPCYGALPDGAAGQSYAYPASLLIESMGQAAAVLWLWGEGGPSSAGGLAADEVLMLTVVRDFRLEGVAFPGDVLRHEVWLDHISDGSAIAVGETWVGARRIASAGQLLAVVRPRSAVGMPADTPNPEESGGISR